MAGAYVTRRAAGPLSAMILLAVALVGCGGGPAPVDTPSSVATPSLTEAPPPPPVGLIPGGSAEDNLPHFRHIVESVWAGPDQASGRAYVDALVAAGFDKSAMQVTEDYSTVGNRAESLQVSVRWGPECLMGQVGPATGDPVAAVLPGLADGGCLVGTTRPIDW